MCNGNKILNVIHVCCVLCELVEVKHFDSRTNDTYAHSHNERVDSRQSLNTGINVKLTLHT